MKEVLVVGTVAFDDVQTPSGTQNNILGGSATHFSLSAVKLVPVHIIGVVGTDFPQKHLSYLQQQGINTDGVSIIDGQTFHWAGKYEGAMNEAVTLQTDLNVLMQFNPVLSKPQQCIPYVFLANIDPDLQMKVLDQLEKPEFVAADSMNFWIDSKKDSLMKVLTRIDMLTINDAEARMLTGESNTIQAGKNILGLGPRFVVIKKGEHGALLMGNKNEILCALPAFPVEKVVDPTGAGDSFAGGMISYCAAAGKTDRQTLTGALVHGTVMASFNVTDFGGRAFETVNRDTIALRTKEFKNYLAV